MTLQGDLRIFAAYCEQLIARRKELDAFADE